MIQDPATGLFWWRWTACVALHVVCSTVAGYGMSRVWRETVRQRSRPQLSLAAPYLIAAIGIHAAYNLLTMITQAWHEF